MYIRDFYLNLPFIRENLVVAVESYLVLRGFDFDIFGHGTMIKSYRKSPRNENSIRTLSFRGFFILRINTALLIPLSICNGLLRFCIYRRDWPAQKEIKRQPTGWRFEDVRIRWIDSIDSGPDPWKRFSFIRSVRQTRRPTVFLLLSQYFHLQPLLRDRIQVIASDVSGSRMPVEIHD